MHKDIDYANILINLCNFIHVIVQKLKHCGRFKGEVVPYCYNCYSKVQITQVQPPKKKRAVRKPRNTKAASTKQSSSSTPEASTSQAASEPTANRTSITLPAEMTHAKLLMQLQYIVEKERNKIAAKQEMGEQDDDTPVDLSTFMKQVVVPNFTAGNCLVHYFYRYHRR